MIEEIILNYLLESGFPVICPCRRSPPAILLYWTRPAPAVRTVFSAPRWLVQSYGKTKYNAAQLSHQVVQAMLDADSLPEVVRCDLVTVLRFSRHHPEAAPLSRQFLSWCITEFRKELLWH